ncbi:MAG: hypothetical protein A3C61_02835 [Candidatus Yanofskybacteria bacterium RIFCSPHIGHO2_02_FULL_39_10]|uniref:Uncharacterized protein n=1 Tax=Candidatus Yanofskybacteria bacterium RIFCSPHIGHO2_02_FULL_39_10 TaxID=1802674 RepID=A0A1F8F7Y7_9BACT|nr:MAG: hypothetical protein A3C61_02835 [Candidatus Yanofskybacteria bacterium RIFCSPHIGHO2_02_FULL_39_10]
MVTKIITENGVSSQVEYFDQAVVSYFYAHEDIASTIRTYKTRYPNNWEVGLFTDLFGQAPKGKIEIEEMPLSVYVKIQNIEDYVFAHIGDSKNESLVNTTRHSGGAALIAREFKKVPKLSKKVVIENTSMVTEEYSKESIKPHEEEHMIHKNMYPRSSFIRWERKWPIKLGKNQEIQFSVFKTIIDDSIHNILVQDWEYSTKTEILAYMKDYSDIDYIKNCLTNPNGLYNYLVDRRDYYLNWFLDHIKKSGSNISSPNHRSLTEDEIKQIYSEALDEAWYKKFLPILERTLNTVKKMFEQYGQDKYPEIMRLLAQEPIDKWPRLARILS